MSSSQAIPEQNFHHFLALPRELRDQIYDLALKVEPIRTHDGARRETVASINLLCANKQVSREALKLLYSTRPFIIKIKTGSIRHLDILVAGIRDSKRKPHFQHIHSLHIEITWDPTSYINRLGRIQALEAAAKDLDTNIGIVCKDFFPLSQLESIHVTFFATTGTTATALPHTSDVQDFLRHLETLQYRMPHTIIKVEKTIEHIIGQPLAEAPGEWRPIGRCARDVANIAARQWRQRGSLHYMRARS